MGRTGTCGGPDGAVAARRLGGARAGSRYDTLSPPEWKKTVGMWGPSGPLCRSVLNALVGPLLRLANSNPTVREMFDMLV
jgi:hypothetical protein